MLSTKPLPPYSGKNTYDIKAGARSSPLSRAQCQELLEEIHTHFPLVTLLPIWVDTTGDLDKKTSLRQLDKTDFFTKEIDQMLLNGQCRIGIHSAKDLPEPLPKGLKIVAVTKGLDPSDSLVLRQGESLETLPPQAIIATSSERREEAVSCLRQDLRFIDLRGTIGERLQKLESGQADAVVLAEAALIRLKLTHLNRIQLPGSTTSAQGKLAVVAKEEDREMAHLFAHVDTRPVALYLGLDFPPENALRKFIHYPLIQIIPRKGALHKKLPHFIRSTHLLFTSKTAARLLFAELKEEEIDIFETMREKKVIAIGRQTARVIESCGVSVGWVSDIETAEGVLEMFETLAIKNSTFFWPHSALSRPLVSEWFHGEGARRGAILEEAILYDTIPHLPGPLPTTESYQEIFFTSPSTVEAFHTFFGNIPEGKKAVSIGKVTEKALSRAF